MKATVKHVHGRKYEISSVVNDINYYGFALKVNDIYHIQWLTSDKSQGKRQAKTEIKIQIEKYLNN